MLARPSSSFSPPRAICIGALRGSLNRANDHLLADQVRVLARRAGREARRLGGRVRREAEEEFENRQHTQVYVRLLDGSGQVLVQTPGISRLLPPADFPAPVQEPGGGG